MDGIVDRNNHPCFYVGASGRCGRVHVPVAPDCNVRCNFCDRRYDCANESRPGVSSAVLTPAQAVSYLAVVLQRDPSITTVGIAGPGDAFADPRRTLDTLALIRERWPAMLFCLATNGLAAAPHAQTAACLGVTHATVTVNAVDPAIGSSIYAWVREGREVRRGEQGAALLWRRQRQAILAFKDAGVTLKVNVIVVPGVNNGHALEVVRTVKKLGADIVNIIPFHPVAGTPLAGTAEPAPEDICSLRREAEKSMPVMKHCARCRADAVGLVGRDRSREFADDLCRAASSLPLVTEGRPHVAVASREGLLVNLHLGEAESFSVWAPEDEGGFRLVEERVAPARGGGVERWRELARILGDCRAVLVSGGGEGPKALLEQSGVLVLEMEGFVEEGLAAIYTGCALGPLSRRRGKGCPSAQGAGAGSGCGGDGGGCG